MTEHSLLVELGNRFPIQKGSGQNPNDPTLRHERIREMFLDLAVLIARTVPPSPHREAALSQLDSAMLATNAAILGSRSDD